MFFYPVFHQFLPPISANFTAFLAGNDDMALGAIKALKEIGKLVPEDISVTGFDNSKIGDFFFRR
ncbi:substrate-binding domain-containing protein [Mangrovibacter phragmitis]|uniref:substrate-binding domain-containing protein n=1 Tax=Mangrovibacter phragmitis TaxID=1691903 RepID=UPI0035161719